MFPTMDVADCKSVTERCRRISFRNFNLRRTPQEAELKGYCKFNISIICRAYWKTCNWFSFIFWRRCVRVNLNDITLEIDRQL